MTATTFLEIVSPAEGAHVGNGNLLMVEAETADPLDDASAWVEVAAGRSDQWERAQPVPSDSRRWRYVWSDPEVGAQQVRVRAVGLRDLGTPEDSVDVQVDGAQTAPAAVDNPYAVAGSYRKGQMHVHSTMSFDGWTSLPPLELAAAYRRMGYQFVVITDHDLITYAPEANTSGFVLIPGYESTVDSGHVVGIFVDRTADRTLAPQKRIDDMLADGGIATLAHPGWRIGWSGTQLHELRGFSLVEIFNGLTATAGDRVQRNLEKWHEILNANGRSPRVWATAVDDAHSPDFMNKGWVMVKTPEVSPAAIRMGLLRGSFYASNGPSFSTIGVMDGAIVATSPDAAIIQFIDQDMQVVGLRPPEMAVYTPTGKERWLRVEAVASDGSTAWSQPFWITN